MGSQRVGHNWVNNNENIEIRRRNCSNEELYFSLFICFSNWRIITLQYCDGSHHHSCVMVHRSAWISLRYTCVPSILNLPSHLPPQPIPPGCQRALALGALYHTSNSHWLSVLHMVIYMFQCYSLKSSYPLLLPLSPKFCSLCLCLLCCPACRIISTIFLNSIHMH